MGNRPVAIVTGATNGIGEATAIELARRGYDIGIVGRNPAKGEATTARIADAAPDATVTFLTADYCNLASVQAVVPEVVAAFPRIDVLVNNAGIHTPDKRTTADGFDEMLQVNYLAPYLLTELLLPHLEAQDRVRIVNVGSEAHRMGGNVDASILTTTPARYSGASSFRFYGKTKLLDLLWTFELARRVDSSRITVNTLCPGTVNTGLVEESAVVQKLSDVLVRTGIVRTPERGARMSIHLASAADADRQHGRFFTSTAPAKILPTRRICKDAALQRRLFDATHERLAELGLTTA